MLIIQIPYEKSLSQLKAICLRQYNLTCFRSVLQLDDSSVVDVKPILEEEFSYTHANYTLGKARISTSLSASLRTYIFNCATLCLFGGPKIPVLEILLCCGTSTCFHSPRLSFSRVLVIISQTLLSHLHEMLFQVPSQVK